jgi:hypothetical protein
MNIVSHHYQLFIDKLAHKRHSLSIIWWKALCTLCLPPLVSPEDTTINVFYNCMWLVVTTFAYFRNALTHLRVVRWVTNRTCHLTQWKTKVNMTPQSHSVMTGKCKM